MGDLITKTHKHRPCLFCMSLDKPVNFHLPKN